MIKVIASMLLVVICTAQLQSQNVGIGTTAPDKLMHIKGFGEILRVQGTQPWIGFMNNTDADYKGFLYYPDTALVMGSSAGSNQPLVLAPNNAGLLYANAQQRVGIGTSAPSEKLDVNGNVNLSGNLRINNTAGEPGQVLMTNSTGNTVWENMFEFKNYRQFNSNSSWTVPANVTKVMIEAWGGGGGGASGGGGGSGSYIRNIISVTPLSVIGVTVGAGGSGATTENGSGSLGQDSYVTIDGNNIGAAGGNPANSIQPGASSETISGGFPGNSLSLLFLPGNSGEPTTIRYSQKSSTEFVTITEYGKGGNPVNAESVNINGGFSIVNDVTLAIIKNIKAFQGSRYGGGGGGGNYTTFSGTFYGSPGGNGVVIIRW